MRENVCDRSECHHDECECRLGGVKAVGPIDDEPHAPIEAFVIRSRYSGDSLSLIPQAAWARDCSA